MHQGNRAGKTFVLWLGIAVVLTVLIADHVLAEDCAKAEKYARKAAEKLKELPDLRYAYERAVEECPANAGYRQKLGNTYRSLALQTLCEMRKTSIPEHIKQQAKTYNELLDMAVSQYLEAAKSTTGNEEALVGLAHTYLLQNRPEMAEECYRKALSSNGANTAAREGLQKAREMKAGAGGQFKTSEQIKHFAEGAHESCDRLTTMGFSPQSVPDMAAALTNRLSFNEILFDEWSSTINRPEAMRQLGEIGQALSSPELAGYNIVVEGHTDHRGGFERNMELSWNRARAIRDYLSGAFGVDPRRISEQGFGYSRPRVPPDSPENMLLLNRRVEVLFLPPTQ